MATSGEIVWRSLMAVKRQDLSPLKLVEDVRVVWSFGKWYHPSTALVPIRDFAFADRDITLPSMITPVIHIHFSRKTRFATLSDEVIYRLSWAHNWKPAPNGQVTCMFRVKEHIRLHRFAGRLGTVYGQADEILLANLPRKSKRDTSRNGRRIIVTPLRLFNLSLISGVLAPTPQGLSPPSKGRSEAFRRKLKVARPSPEIKTRTFTTALEFPSVPYSESTVTKEIYRREWTGTTTPGFGAKSSGQLPDNPHTVDIEMNEYQPGWDLRRTYANPTTTYSNGWGPDYYTSLGGPVKQTDSQFGVVANAAVANLNANAGKGIQGNIALTLAQGNQVTHMIAKNAKNVALAVSALKKGRVSLAIDHLLSSRSGKSPMRAGNPSRTKSLAENWLELQYGWKPLLGDIEGAMKAYAALVATTSNVQQVRGFARRTSEGVTPIYGPGSTTLPIGHFWSSSTWQCKYGIKYRISDANKAFLSQTGFTNPINFIWEILPWSFVFDWFLPIGPYLESMSAPQGLTVVGGYKVLFGRRIRQADVNFSGPMPGAPLSELRASGFRTQRSVSLARLGLTAWPTQRFPQLKSPISTTHALNALALLRAIR